VFSPPVLKSDTLAIPAILSASSAFSLLVYFLLTRKIIEDGQEHEQPPEEASRGFSIKLCRQVNRFGGPSIFIWRILRLLAVLDLVGLAVATLVLAEDVAYDSTHHAWFLNWSVLGAYVRVLSLRIAGDSHHFTVVCVYLGSDRRIDTSKNRKRCKRAPHLGFAWYLGSLRV
jgi:hypothetical protein